MPLYLPGEVGKHFTAHPAVSVFAVLVGAAGFASGDWPGVGWSSPWSALLIVLAMCTVVASSHVPRGAAAGAIVIASIGILARGAALSYVLALLVTLFVVARSTNRRTALIFGAAALLAVASSALRWGDISGVFQFVAYIGMAVAIGDATRSRRAFIDSLTERTRRAEEALESEARRRVAEERLRIAQDLHDLMAHQIAVISLNSNVALQAVRERPEDAERALDVIRSAARTVLGEIGNLLAVLRAGDYGNSTGPTPGLHALPDLLQDFCAGGLDVEVRETGEKVTLSGPSDVVAYRIIQEALTNAQKHGLDHSALLLLEWSAVRLEITVTNSIAPAKRRSVSPGGHGLLGVTERLHSVGGGLETTFGPGPVHRFTAWLPADHTAALIGDRSSRSSRAHDRTLAPTALRSEP